MTTVEAGIDEVVVSRWSPARSIGLCIGLYAFGSLIVLWNVVAVHPTTRSICGCGDPARYLWFVEYPAWALTHGASLLHATRVFPPNGLNLLDDTSVLGFGIPLAPLSWLAGPVASLNAALFVLPVLSATGMLLLLRRWVESMPIAFVGGLAWGFSLYMMTGLISGWLNFVLVTPPLMVLCLDLLLTDRRRSPVLLGGALGGLVVVQYFLSTELLVVTALSALVALVVLGVLAAVRRPDGLGEALRRLGLGTAVGLGVSVVLLAYPLWVTFAGPAHLSGLVWLAAPPGYFGVTLEGFVRWFPPDAVTTTVHRFGGYQGPAIGQMQYLGWSALVAVLAGLVLCRRLWRAWVAAAVGAVGVWCCLTPDRRLNDFWVPWRILARVPVVQNVLPIRFTAVVLFGLIAVVALAARALQVLVEAQGRRRWPVGLVARVLGGLAAGVLLVAAMLPQGARVIAASPLTATPVVLPAWFDTAGRHQPAGRVILTYPVVFGGLQAPLAWQAVDTMGYSLVGGDGPRSDPSRAGRERPGYVVLSHTDTGWDPATWLTARSVAKVSIALRQWGTTTVVEPDEPELPAYDRGDHPAEFAVLITAATGVTPRLEHRAWVWHLTTTSTPATISAAEMMACVGRATTSGIAAATACVVGRSGGLSPLSGSPSAGR